MDFNCISPYIRVAWDNTLSASEVIFPRINYDYELVYFQDGQGVITIESRRYDIEPGDLFLIRPAVTHAIYPVEYLHQPHIHFDLIYEADSPTVTLPFKLMENMSTEEKNRIRKDILADSPYDLPEKITVRNRRLFEEMLYEVIGEYQIRSAHFEMNLKAKFLRLFCYLLQEQERSNSPYLAAERHELEQIRAYIHSAAYTNLSLDALAKEFNLSKYYLTRIFKNCYSVSPIHYHQKVRMEKIREAILYTNRSLTDIAEDFGFESASVFSRAFRSAEGIAPSALRKGTGAKRDR